METLEERRTIALERLAEAQEVANGLTLVLGDLIRRDDIRGQAVIAAIMQLALDRIKPLDEAARLRRSAKPS